MKRDHFFFTEKQPFIATVVSVIRLICGGLTVYSTPRFKTELNMPLKKYIFQGLTAGAVKY
jgi:hypothetical protein